VFTAVLLQLIRLIYFIPDILPAIAWSEPTARVEESHPHCTRRIKTVTFLINDGGMMQLWVAIERIFLVYILYDIILYTLHTACI